MGWAVQANEVLRACHVWYVLVATTRACVVKGWGSDGLPGGQRASLGSFVSLAEKQYLFK